MNFICGTYFKHQCRLQLSSYNDPRTSEFFPKEDQDLDNNFVSVLQTTVTLTN